MNSKLIAIIAVVAMCGAALVGVGYAYSATYTSQSNSATADVNYVYIDTDMTSYTMTVSGKATYNTVNSLTTKTATLDTVSGSQAVEVSLKDVGDDDNKGITTLYMDISSYSSSNAIAGVQLYYEVGNSGTKTEVADSTNVPITLVDGKCTITFGFQKTSNSTVSVTEGKTFANLISDFSASFVLTFDTTGA